MSSEGSADTMSATEIGAMIATLIPPEIFSHGMRGVRTVALGALVGDLAEIQMFFYSCGLRLGMARFAALGLCQHHLWLARDTEHEERDHSKDIRINFVFYIYIYI